MVNASFCEVINFDVISVAVNWPVGRTGGPGRQRFSASISSATYCWNMEMR